MKRIIKVFLPAILSWTCTYSQLTPEPGARLNYTQVMFDHPLYPGADEYLLQLFEYTSVYNYDHPLVEDRDSSTAFRIDDLIFGKKYFWRYTGLKNGKVLHWNGPYNFEVSSDPYLGTHRVRVIKNDSLKNAQGLISIDGIRSIVDREGKPVLFMPMSQGNRINAVVDDLRLTKYGTLCSIGGQSGVETDLKGNVLWITPPKTRDRKLKDFTDFFNHDFLRLNNGHYMVIGSDYQWKTLPDEYYIDYLMYDTRGNKLPDSLACKNGTLHLKGSYVFEINNDQRKLYMNMASICEYDKHDSLVWAWYPESYLQDTDIFPPGKEMKVPIGLQEPHLNGFCTDENNQYVYVSFRSLSRLVKVEKATGKVVESWGNQMASGEARLGEGFFHLEHGPAVLKNGDLAVYDNGDSSVAGGYSNVVVFSQPGRHRHKSKIVWQFACKFDSSTYTKSVRGGNVDQLYNNNFLVCQGAINRVFEITPKKYVSWQALVETKKDTGWIPQGLYRAHYTSSLYPCYFNAQVNTDSLRGKEAAFRIKLYNKGSESDSYTVKILQTCSDENTELQADVLPPGNSEYLNVRLKGPPQEPEDVEVTVISNTNPDLHKRFILHWTQVPARQQTSTAAN